jgi:hypothetical protein
MAHVLIIDDEPELLREKVCQVFPAPQMGATECVLAVAYSCLSSACSAFRASF